MSRPDQILVAEDSATLRLTLTKSLTQRGYTVTAVEDGRLALDILQAGAKFDVVITDVNMPRMTGLELLHAMRGDDRLKTLWVIVCSTDNSQWLIGEVEGYSRAFYADKYRGLEDIEYALQKIEKGVDPATP